MVHTYKYTFVSTYRNNDFINVFYGQIVTFSSPFLCVDDHFLTGDRAAYYIHI